MGGHPPWERDVEDAVPYRVNFIPRTNSIRRAEPSDRSGGFARVPTSTIHQARVWLPALPGFLRILKSVKLYFYLEKYFPQYLALNRGIAGETTFGLEKRLKVSVYDLKPKVAVMLIGANNFDTMFDNYENILKGFKENLPNTKIVLLSLTSMSQEWGKNNQKAAYNNVKIKLLSEKYGYEFVDLYSPLLNLETGEIYAEYTTDGGHLTSAGYEVLTNTITPALEQLLGI